MQEFHEALHDLTNQLGEIFHEIYEDPGSHPIFPRMSPDQIVNDLHATTPPRTGLGAVGALKLFREKVLPASVRTWHPKFFNQMFAGASPIAAVSDAISAMLNTTLATWEMSPAGTVIERDAARWMAAILGMRPGSSGVFLPGGSLANLMALAVARYRVLGRETSHEGLCGRDDRPVILCSDASHYSVANAAMMMGIGTDQVIKVATNHRNEMLADDLVEKLAWCDRNGAKPFAIVATMGITVTGGFDPLREILNICKPRGIHVHADAAFGGGAALSDHGPALLDGIDEADTVIWDAHKWFHVPLACTALLAPDPSIFERAFATNASYLFHPQDEAHELTQDLGNSTILCGKRFDGLRVWLMFQAMGEEFFRSLAQSRMNLVRDAHDLLAAEPGFLPSYEPAGPIQCFRYLPGNTIDAPPRYQDALHRHIRETIKERGKMLFNVAKLGGRDHFRAIMINPLTNLEHFREVVDAIRTEGDAYIAANPVPSMREVG